jgi:multiple sugar transport system permease protein
MKSSLPRNRKIRDARDGYAFISLWLIGFFALTLIPLLFSFYLSFTDYDLLTPPVWTGLNNFITMFTKDPRYWKSVFATLYYAVAAVPLRLIVALAIALVLNTNRKGVAVYRALYYAPSIVGSSVAVSVMWRQYFGTEGIFNALLNMLGIPSNISWTGDPRFAIWTLILLAAWQFGSPMLVFLSGLKQIPSELYESASIDGASGIKKFFKITLPLLSPVILFNLIMQMINGFIVFTPALIITNGQPLDTTNFYALYLYKRGFENFQMGYASGMAWILLVVISVFSIFIFKTSSRWVFYETERGR